MKPKFNIGKSNFKGRKTDVQSHKIDCIQVILENQRKVQ